MAAMTPCLRHDLMNSAEPGSSGASSQRFMQGYLSSSGSYSSATGGLIHSGICAPACLGLKYGPSRWSPSTGLFSSAMSFSQVSHAASIIGTVDDDSVGKIAVVPCFMCALMATRKASSEPSMKSRPPPPCTCISMPPGTIWQPLASMISASTMWRSLFDTALILLPSMITEPPSSQPSGVRMRPLIICFSIMFG